MARLDDLYRLHRVVGPDTTLWDAWVPMSVLWLDTTNPPALGTLRSTYRDRLLRRRMNAGLRLDPAARRPGTRRRLAVSPLHPGRRRRLALHRPRRPLRRRLRHPPPRNGLQLDPGRRLHGPGPDPASRLDAEGGSGRRDAGLAAVPGRHPGGPVPPPQNVPARRRARGHGGPRLADRRGRGMGCVPPAAARPAARRRRRGGPRPPPVPPSAVAREGGAVPRFNWRGCGRVPSSRSCGPSPPSTAGTT